MKQYRVIGLGMAALLSLAICAGCAPVAAGHPDNTPEGQHTASQLEQPNGETQTPAPEEPVEDIPFLEGQQYAVAYLGFQKIDNWEHYQALYHLDQDEIPTYWISDGDYYLVIPRYAGTSVTIERVDINTSNRALSHTIRNAGPFIVQCNVSDIFADTVITLTHDDVSVEFSPFLSLKDGTLELGEEGLNITAPDVLPEGEGQEVEVTGTYGAPDGSQLTIGMDEDGQYTVDLSILRLTALSDGVGSFENGVLHFTATDAAGNPISGEIALENGLAAVTITDSTWAYLPNGETFHFGKDVGTYTALDGSTLTVGLDVDGQYQVNVSIVRLTALTGTATYSEGALHFTAEDAAGNPISGAVSVAGGAAMVTITDSDWAYLPDGEVFHFGRCVGEYAMADGSTLTVNVTDSGAYTVDVSIARLTSLSDGVGTYENGVIRFTATDAADNLISGTVSEAEGVAVLTITDSTWSYLPNDETFFFGKAVGNYAAENGSTLAIGLNADGAYTVDLSILRLTSLSGVGSCVDGEIAFTATDAAGNPISGLVSAADGEATVRITDSTWSYLPADSTFTFTEAAAE